MDLGEHFDTYSLRARLQPALLTLFPLFVTAAVWLPVLYQTAAGLLGLASACGVTVLLAHVTRERGRRAERRLFEEWGGNPTTIWLRHRDDNLDNHTTRRYHAYLASNAPGWQPPTPEEERSDPAAVDRRYDTAVKWLLENSRDRPLVLKENVAYGFRRNLYGLRPLGLSLALLCAGANGAAIYYSLEDDLEHLNLAGAASLAISIVAVLTWLFVVNKAWVRDAAHAYARALTASCEG